MAWSRAPQLATDSGGSQMTVRIDHTDAQEVYMTKSAYDKVRSL